MKFRAQTEFRRLIGLQAVFHSQRAFAFPRWLLVLACVGVLVVSSLLSVHRKLARVFRNDDAASSVPFSTNGGTALSSGTNTVADLKPALSPPGSSATADAGTVPA